MTENRRLNMTDKMINKIYASSRLHEAGFVMASPHCHPYYEIFYVEYGACSFFIDNNMYDLRAGDFMLIPPQVFHSTRYMYGACRRSNIFFRMENVDGVTVDAMPGKRQFFEEMRVFQMPEAYRDQTAFILSGMIKEQKINDERSAPLLEALFKQLLLLCSRVCVFLSDMPAKIHTTDRQIVVAAKFISINYAEDISTADIAAAAGYSPNYLSKKFREATGIGIHEYLIFTRLQRAALELLSTDHSITEIAARCGFSDGNYFKDAFKKKFGVTPREYRKMPAEP